MSRGSKVFYIDSVADITPGPDLKLSISTTDGTDTTAQELDLAVVRNNVLSADLATNGTQSFQVVRRETHPFDLFWKEFDLDDEAQRIYFTDDVFIPNVTKVRKSHTEEIRNFINMLYTTYASRYGSKYYHAHDFTNAKLFWAKDSDTASMEFVNYGPDKKWLTLFFGDNSTVGDVDFSDRFRIAYLGTGTTTPVDIVDFMGWCTRFYKDVNLTENLNVDKMITAKDLSVLGTASINVLSVDGLSTFKADVTANENVNVLKKLTTKDLDVTDSTNFRQNLTVGNLLTTKDFITTGVGIMAELQVTRLATIELLRAIDMRLMGQVFYYKNTPLISVSADNKRVTIGDGNYGSSAGSVISPYDSINVMTTLFQHNALRVLTVGDYNHRNDSSGINADMVDNYHVGRASGQIPISNGLLNTDLNANFIEGNNWQDILDYSKEAVAHSLAGGIVFRDGGALVHGVQQGHHPGDGSGFNACRLDNKHLDDILAGIKITTDAIAASVPTVFIWRGIVADSLTVGGPSSSLSVLPDGFNISNCVCIVTPNSDDTLLGGPYAGGEHNATLTKYAWVYKSTSVGDGWLIDAFTYVEVGNGCCGSISVAKTKYNTSALVYIIGVTK